MVSPKPATDSSLLAMEGKRAATEGKLVDDEAVSPEAALGGEDIVGETELRLGDLEEGWESVNNEAISPEASLGG